MGYLHVSVDTAVSVQVVETLKDLSREVGNLHFGQEEFSAKAR